MENTIFNKFMTSLAVMDIARTVQNVENLASLSDGAEERVVTSLAFLLWVESDCCSLGPSISAKQRAVKVQRYSAKCQRAKARQDKFSNQGSQLFYRLKIERAENAAYGRDVRQTFQRPDAKNYRILVVVFYISQLTKAHKNMYNQTENDGGRVVDMCYVQVAETFPQPRSKVQSGYEGLEDNQAGEWTQALALKLKLRNLPRSFTSDLFCAKSHLATSFVLCRSC